MFTDLIKFATKFLKNIKNSEIKILKLKLFQRSNNFTQNLLFESTQKKVSPSGLIVVIS